MLNVILSVFQVINKDIKATSTLPWCFFVNFEHEQHNIQLINLLFLILTLNL